MSSKSSSQSGSAFSPGALREILLSRLGFNEQTPFLLALSGGADSVALLAGLVDAGWQPRAVHVDHGLQEDSGGWADACTRLCARLGVACQIVRVKVDRIGDLGYEAAAREARYGRLREIIRRDEVLLTAHHQDDQAETVMIQMLRGSGLAGLSAMPAVVSFGNGWLARPLLSFRRTALREFLANRGLDWVEDGSNTDFARPRSVLRHRILPQLIEHWPGAVQTLARSARHAAQAQALLDELATQDLSVAEGERGALVVSRLLGLSEARRANLIRYWLRRLGFQLPSEAQLDEILRVVTERPRSGGAMVRWLGATLRRHRDSLVVLPADSAPTIPGNWQPLPWDLVEPLLIEGAGLRLWVQRAIGAGLSLARVAGRPVSVRPRVGGEMCRLAGHRHRRSLKKLLQENDVPPWERPRLPLVYVGDDLAAVADRWVCEPYAARAQEPGVKLVIEDLAHSVSIGR